MLNQRNLLCSGKERERFLEQLINEMATPFLKLEHRTPGFHWEDFFAYQVPIAIYDILNKEMAEVFHGADNSLYFDGEMIKLPDLKSLIRTYRDHFFATHGIRPHGIEDFADSIEAWHNLPEDDVSLSRYLGMTEAQYAYMIAFGQVFV